MHVLAYQSLSFDMNSGLGNGGVLITSGLLNGGTGSGGGGGSVFEEGVDFYVGPNGSSRRNWRIRVSGLQVDTNALLIEHKSANGTWQTSQVFVAKTT